MTEKNHVRIGQLADELGISVRRLRALADREKIPSFRSPGGHRLFDISTVRAALSGSDEQSAILPPEGADWSDTVALREVDEAEVWARAASDLALDLGDESGKIASYAFTEMLNNAIDHSGGEKARIELWADPQGLSFRIADDGRGIFAHLRQGLELDSEIEAAAELTKGKRTTLPDRHTGEGIFFTSKAVKLFRLSANALRLTVDNTRGDTALGVSPVTTGTAVEVVVARPAPRTLRSVFEEFTDDDLRFTRSRPVVKLFGSGVAFVSRSEARRVMADMGDFSDIDIDFQGVDDVGQGFVDEILRVWPSQHPETSVHPINMNEAVEFMVRRAQR